MVPQVGQRIGPYEILGRLGSGGMGLVFSAWDARLQRDVAIKILREEYATPDMRSRFLQEARAASGLNHPNICTIFDIGEQEGDPFLVMELLKGETLRARMNAGGIQIRDVIRVAHDVADALASAHGRGIIHRDIKPANIILVDKPGGGVTTKVLDFGLAKIDTYGAESVFDLTHTGTTVGTVSYMSPEQARGEALDARSDLFSLGVVLYEMATGRLPFQGATSALVFVELLSNPPDPIRPQNPLVTEDLEHLILKMLEKDRTLRYQSAQLLVEAIDQIPFAGSTPSRNWNSAPATPVTPPRVIVPQPAQSSRAMPVAPKPQPPAATPTGSSAIHRAQSQRPTPPRKPGISPTGSSAIHRTAHPVDADEVIRPVKRVVTTDSSRAKTGESSAIQPVAPAEPSPSPLPAPVEPPQPVPETPYSDRMIPESSTSLPVPSRPIVPQSARGPQAAIPHISLPRITSQRPQPRFQRIDEPEPPSQSRAELPPAPTPIPLPPLRVLGEPAAAKPKGWLLPVSLLVMLLIGLVAWKLWPSHPAAIEDRLVPIAMGPVQNTTGITTLTSAFAAGIALDLAQSPQFQVSGIAALGAGLHAAGITSAPVETSLDDLRKGAQKMGVTEILLGEIRNNGNAFTLGVHVRSVATGDELFHAEETAQSQPQIPDALDRLVIDLRNGLNEPADELQRTSMPLARDATGNLDALSAYSDGLASFSRGQLEAAAVSFESATRADANFTQAYLRLADVYRAQHAQLAAAAAANTAKTTSQNASQRTQQLADACYALNVTDDVSAVATVTGQLLDAYPNEVQARIDAATALREQGKFPEAFDAIQVALRRSPFNSSALSIAESVLLAQGRPNSSRPLEDQAEHAGRAHPGLRLLMNFVAAGQQGPIDLSGDATGRIALAETQAALLDATGSAREALHRWQSIAVDATAADSMKLSSASGDALSYAALNRALTADCTNANSLAQSAGDYPLSPEASFRTALASALCGNPAAARSTADNLSRANQQSFLVKSIFVPELIAVAQWKEGDLNAALNTLSAAQQTDFISLAAYLRGEVHMKAGQPAQAITDYQIITGHPGPAVLVNPLLPAIAQLGLARAYAASGDSINSSTNYAKFLTLWSGADPNSPLVAEARAHSAH